MLQDKIKTLLDICEVESSVLTILTYDELTKIYSALMAMNTYATTLDKCLITALDKEILRINKETENYTNTLKR